MKPLLLASMALSLTAYASAPQVKTQAPGYYRMMVGSIEVTALFDGFFPMKPREFLREGSVKKVEALLKKAYQGDTIPTSCNAFLINTGTKLVLVDSGSGAFFGPAFGHVVENLKAAGYQPEQVDEIVITHAHTDHLGGVVADGKAVYPNAVLRMDQRDADFWLNAKNATKVVPMARVMFPNAVAAVAPYKASGRFKPFSGETEIVPGVRAIPAYGHTAGHTAYSIESGGKKLLLVGDLLHIEALQFPDPSITLIADTDSKVALGVRKRIFKEAAAQGFLIGGAHLAFPGVGHVAAVAPGYRFLPIPYVPVP